MKQANAPKYLQAEQEDRERLEARGRKAQEETTEIPAELQPEVSAPNDGSLQATADDAPASEPLSAEARIETEDASFLYGDSATMNDDSNAHEDVDGDVQVDDAADAPGAPEQTGDAEMVIEEVATD